MFKLAINNYKINLTIKLIIRSLTVFCEKKIALKLT